MTESTTLTVMFTDMVASTERSAAVGELTGAVVRRKLFELLCGATSVTGGNEVKNLGDGLMITFPTVRAGLEAAVLMQRRAARYNRARVGAAGVEREAAELLLEPERAIKAPCAIASPAR